MDIDIIEKCENKLCRNNADWANNGCSYFIDEYSNINKCRIYKQLKSDKIIELSKIKKI